MRRQISRVLKVACDLGGKLGLVLWCLFLVLSAYRTSLFVFAALLGLFSWVPQITEGFWLLAEADRPYDRLLFIHWVACLAGLSWAMLGVPKQTPWLAQSAWIHRSVAALVAGTFSIALVVGVHVAVRGSGIPDYDVESSWISEADYRALPQLMALASTLDEGRSVLLGALQAMSVISGATILLAFVGYPFWARSEFRWVALGVCLALTATGLVALVLVGTEPLVWGVDFGFLPIVVIWLVVLGSILAILARSADVLQVPLLGAALTLLVFLAATNHRTPHLVQWDREGLSSLQDADESFKQWWDTRSDKGQYQGKPYPVFIVAAAGGGAYAARYAAAVLANIQDHCPNFSQHVFAISGVSGGALGGSAFAHLAALNAENGAFSPCTSENTSHLYRSAVDSFFETDILTPVVASALTTDLAQSVWPWGLSETSRARVFEESISVAWRNSSNADDLQWNAPFLEHWRPDGAAPALVLNATNVENAWRVTMAPFKVVDALDGNRLDPRQSGTIELPSLRYCGNEDARLVSDVTMAEAISLSSRFPYILPAAEIQGCGGSVLRIVDGGYVDNSGLDTVNNLVDSLMPSWLGFGENGGPSAQIQIHVISIRGGTARSVPSGRGPFDFAISPLQTLLSNLDHRPDVAGGAFERRDAECSIYFDGACAGRISFIEFRLDFDDFNLPLGFGISRASAQIVDLMTGELNRVPSIDGTIGADTRMVSMLGYMAFNDYALRRVTEALSPNW